MRCRACNRPFTDYENVSKNAKTGDYEDLCIGCRRSSGMGYSLDGEIPVSGSITVPLLDILPNGPRI